ncbi:MAG TPA: XrtA/PEP-CTERM system TPR-repeat protein PrsT [Pseudoduganella sp.]
MSHRITFGAGLVLIALVACERLQPADKLLEEARQYRAQGDLRAAVIQAKTAVQQKPDDALARQMLGELYLDQGNAAPAEKELRRAVELGRPRAEVLPALGKAVLLQGTFQRLLVELASEPDSAAVLALRAEAQLGMGKPDLAAPLFRQALQVQPASAAALLGLARLALSRNQQPEALRYADQAIVAQPREVEALRFKGDLLRAQGRLEAARLVYESILKLRPSNVQARVDIAALAIDAGQLDQAREQIAAARKTQPNSLLIYHAQALLDFREQRYEDARDQVQHTLRAAPDHPPTLLLAASIELALNDLTQARLYLEKFLLAAPGHPYATGLLAHIAIRSKQPEEALRLLQPLLEGEDENADLLALAGDAAMQSRHFEQAAAFYERAARLDPDSARLRTSLGLSRLGMGENQRAIAELERASARDGAHSRTGLLLILTYMRSNEFAKALEHIDSLIAQGDNPMLQNLRAGALAARGDTRGARAALEKALKQDPLYQPAHENLTQLDLAEKNADQARQRLLAALNRDKTHIGMMNALSRLAASLGRSAEAVEWMERAHVAKPDAIEPAAALVALYLRSGAPDKAMNLARKLHTANPFKPELLALLAQAESDNGEHARALESYSRLAVMRPSSAAVQLRIATTQMSLRHPNEALAAVRRALALEPERDDALALASGLLIDKGALPEAVALAQGIQRRRPKEALGFKLEGDALQAQAKYEEALKRYERGFELMGSGPLVISIHRTLRAAGRQAAAAARVEQWLEKNPTDAPTRLYFASALLQDNDYKSASLQYQQILRANPDNVVALNDLAWCYLQLSDGRAKANAEHAYKLAPENPAVADTLGAVLTRQGQAERALPLLKKALGQSPASPEIRLHYAQALFQSGDKPAARAQCEQLLAMRDIPQLEEVKALMARL